MSDKLSMTNVEKAKLQLVVPALVRAQIERLSSAAGISINEYGNLLLDRGLAKVPTTPEDLARANEIIAQNIQARKERKAQKGIF